VEDAVSDPGYEDVFDGVSVVFDVADRPPAEQEAPEEPPPAAGK